MRRKIFTGEGHYHFVTFSCYGRRKLLKDEQAKQIVIHVFSKLLKEKDIMVIGFVIMPDHVHAIFGYHKDEVHSRVMQELKRRSSILLRKYLAQQEYPSIADLKKIWQRKYYDFNLYDEEKLVEKLNYIHQNPVKAGLVKKAIDYKWSSCRKYELGKGVGVIISNVI